MRIRAATIGDVPLILALIRELGAYERLSHEVVATESSLASTLFCPRPAAEVLIAELGGAPVGFALFFANYSTFVGRPGIYLEDLFVRPDARGQGVGRALLSHLARIALDRDCGRLEWAVLDWNVDAIGFYEKLGATGMHDWTIYRVSRDKLAALAADASD